MPKVVRKELSSAPFSFARQFTAPPFFMGLEDARLKSQLLLGAVKKSGAKQATAKPAKRKPAKKTTKTRGKKK